MTLLHDAPGTTCRITVTESDLFRYLELDGCEEGAMNLYSEDPVFNYLWFYRCSMLAAEVRRALVLGAGAFTAAKCLALAHPQADIETVDVEAELEPIGRRYFRLDRPEFGRVRFHARRAEDYLAASPEPCGFVFDDLFDGFQHVPRSSLQEEHFHSLRRAVAPGGICIKNVIWEPGSATTRASCTEAFAAMKAAFPHAICLALGPPQRGHNRILVGSIEPLIWHRAVPRLLAGGMPESVVAGIHLEAGQ